MLLVIKLAMSALSGWDCLAGALVFVSIEASRILDQIFPKRVDLFKEVLEISEQVKLMKAQLDESERDLTALKFQNMRPK